MFKAQQRVMAIKLGKKRRCAGPYPNLRTAFQTHAEHSTEPIGAHGPITKIPRHLTNKLSRRETFVITGPVAKAVRTQISHSGEQILVEPSRASMRRLVLLATAHVAADVMFGPRTQSRDPGHQKIRYECNMSHVASD